METTQPSTVAGEEAAKVGSKPKPAVADKAKKAATAAKPTTAESPVEVTGQQASEPLKSRRRFVWTAVVGFLTIDFFMFLRFFFPRALFEPSTRFKIGTPDDFPIGVDERFKQSNRIWVVRQPDKVFVIFAKCTHLGCTPNWIETENKFKCPCHGSGYDREGVNFEGPAPRPMDRAYVERDADGQIIVDTSTLFSCPPGEECNFDKEHSYLVV